MAAPRIIELRKLLGEKFPGSALRFDENNLRCRNRWQSNVPAVDQALRGGLPKGGLTEIVASERSCGSASLTRAILDQASHEKQIIALVDASDSLDVTGLSETTLARLLWVRCRSANESLKAVDLLLRDSNFSLVILDLAGNSPAELRRIPATVWYRLQRLVEETPVVCAVLTLQPMVSPARVRITLRSRFSIEALDQPAEELLRELTLEAAESRESADRQFA